MALIGEEKHIRDAKELSALLIDDLTLKRPF